MALILENALLRLTFDPQSGSIVSLFNKPRGIEAIEPGDVDSPPWRVQVTDLDPSIFDSRQVLRGTVVGMTEIVLHFLEKTVGGSWISGFDSFTGTCESAADGGGVAMLRWSRADGLDVEGRVELPADEPDARFSAIVRNGSDQCVLAIEYPIIDGIRPLGDDSADDYIAHSVDGGFLFRDPHRLFRDPGILDSWRRLRMIDTTDPSGHPDEGTEHGGLYRLHPYPNGYQGVPMQFLAHFRDGVGGFYVAAHDPNNGEKAFHFFASERRRGLTCSIVHYSWNWERGADLDIDYPTMVGSLVRGTWYEAAERYRAWATGTGAGHPDWCTQGTLRERVDAGTASRWLVEEVGFNTFGLPMSIDISAWYDAFHAIAGKPVMHIVGHDWEGGALRIRPDKWNRLLQLLTPTNPAPSLFELAEVLGIEPTASNEGELRRALLTFRVHLWNTFMTEPLEHLPPTFDPQNVATMRANGDRLVPFLWRDFIGYGHDTEAYGCLAPIGPFTTSYMCPTTDYWREWHARTDAAIVESGVDGLYYDVSASCATPTVCMNRRHGHPIGFARDLVRSYADVFRLGKERARVANDGEYVPMGTEVIIENLIGVVDFAQCRAGAGVQASMDGEEFVEWQKDGRATKIPMFAYVYHDYGPVLCDGWLKLSRRYGEIFFEIAARVALEGGLVQLNYEFSSPELFAGMEGSSYQLVYTALIFEDTAPLAVDGTRLAFLAELVEARTGFAKDYLAYGRMVEPLPIISDVPDIVLDWDHFNSIHRLRLEQGELTTSSIVQVGWSDGRRSLGYLFVNLLPDRSQTITVVPDATLLTETGGRTVAAAITSTERTSLGAVAADVPISLDLPPRRVVLLEITPPDVPA